MQKLSVRKSTLRWLVATAVLGGLAFTANHWSPQLFKFVVKNTDLIQGLASLSTLILFICTILSALYGVRSANKHHNPSGPAEDTEAMSNSSKNQLSKDEMKTVINLLEESERAFTPEQRRALIEEIELNPALFQFHSLGSHDFSVSFVNTINRRYSLTTMLELLDCIEPYVEGRKDAVCSMKDLILSRIDNLEE